MAELMSVSVHAVIKSFGARVFELTRTIEGDAARAARRAVADASRAFSRTALAGDEKRSQRAAELTFKSLGDAVRALDAIAAAATDASVPASALAAEGAALADAAFDRLARA